MFSSAAANDGSRLASGEGSISPPRIIVPGSCEYMRARFSNFAEPVMTRSRMSSSRSRVRCLAAVIDLGNLVICA